MSLLGVCLLGGASITGAQVQEEFKLTASDGAGDDHFGWVLAISGDRAIVGAADDDDNGPASGSAYVFDLTTGQQLAKLTASDGAPGDAFGRSVAISGDKAIVGAFYDDDDGPASGSAYVFDVTTGQQLAKLTASDGAAGEVFGWSVAISGDRALVGAAWGNDNGFRSGSAYAFDVTTGQQLLKLTASDGAAEDMFGQSVAISGDRAIVGAHLNDDDGSASGSAYVFDVATGKQLAKLTASDGAASNQFGISVAISGDQAIVGANGDDSAYVFDVTTGRQLAKLTASDGKFGDGFGWSVAIRSDRAIVGSPSDDDNGSGSGSAYVFDPTTGQQLAKLTASDGVGGDFFGTSVAISGERAVVGAFQDDDNGTNSGSAYVFESLDGCGTTYCGTAQNPNNAAQIEVETCDSSSASILLSLSGGPPNQFAYLLVGDGNGTVSQPPGAKGDLCVVGGACLGRYDKDVGQISAAGTFSTDIQNALSNPCAGAVNIAPGATWNFQYWHRQPMGAPATFSEAISVTFQ